MRAGKWLLVACLSALPLLGQPAQTPASPVAAPVPPAATGTPAAQDSLAAPKSRADTVLVVKHRFDHREQIITGSVVMTCLALMMVVMNNYNPR